MKSPLLCWLVPSAILLCALQGCASKTGTSSTAQSTTTTRVTAPSTPRRPQLKLDEILQKAASKPSVAFEGEGWQKLFDGKTLAGWRETDFAGRGEVDCQFGMIILNTGDPFTGINFTNSFPNMNYELALDAVRVTGSDFFCGLTIPVGTNSCSLIVGGWGGSLVGISSLDSMDASENETTKYINFEQDQWYRIRIRVTDARLEAWIDKDKIVNVVTTGRRISVRPGDIEMSRPFGISCWQTTTALREIQWRPVTSPAGPAKKD